MPAIDNAVNAAIKAERKSREGEHTTGVGEGLAAIAWALLDVAQAIREHTTETMSQR